MIRSFKCRETQLLWNVTKSKKFPFDIQDRALRKLSILDSANRLEDLRDPSSNHLEPLKGNRKGQMSIRVNKQWRICFIWNDNDAFDVEIIDYH